MVYDRNTNKPYSTTNSNIGTNRKNGNMQNQNNTNTNIGNSQRNEENKINFTKEDAQKVLNLEDKDGKELFRFAEELGKKIKEDVSVSQIRKIYSEIKKLEYDDKGDYKYKLRLIKAQIGYTAGRFTKLRDLKEYLYLLIDVVLEGNKEHLKRFKDFFEAVIAYHRAYGGK
ncbi:type III-A CRISPR-associated protein Csm2 [Caloramator sp. E03]|uniref:type III-A CRISPR-associated protein Csm2 n=1 Tax=Caloramator sp. E03 TaxID=2576307 RepID=UPI001110CF8E|nr:type III-A CRISPR-associated protein Csm2 [Caloramator sp. E03]QCX34075.1 type III-A CRISPR-associated protein Csm2 [Caloramator sp. E03]